MEYKIKKSRRKTLALKITADCEIVVYAPFYVKDDEIEKFLLNHRKWIEKNYPEIVKKAEQRRLINENKEEFIKKAKAVLPEKVGYYSRLTGLSPSSLKITSAQKRFGSCSSKNAICFSYILMNYPEEAIDYVVLHEIAHIKYHNHSAAFYRFIGQYMPDYKEREKLLK